MKKILYSHIKSQYGHLLITFIAHCNSVILHFENIFTRAKHVLGCAWTLNAKTRFNRFFDSCPAVTIYNTSAAAFTSFFTVNWCCWWSRPFVTNFTFLVVVVGFALRGSVRQFIAAYVRFLPGWSWVSINLSGAQLREIRPVVWIVLVDVVFVSFIHQGFCVGDIFVVVSSFRQIG